MDHAPLAVSKVVSARLALKEYRNAHRVFMCALLYVLIVGGAASILTFFGAGILVGSSQINAAPVLQVLAPTIFFSGFLGVFRGYFQAHGTMVPTSLSQIVEQVANAILQQGQGIAAYCLAEKVYKDKGETEYSDKEGAVINSLMETLPAMWAVALRDVITT